MRLFAELAARLLGWQWFFLSLSGTLRLKALLSWHWRPLLQPQMTASRPLVGKSKTVRKPCFLYEEIIIKISSVVVEEGKRAEFFED